MLEIDLRDLEAPRARFTFDQYVRAHDLASSLGLEPLARMVDEGLAPDGRRLYGARFAPMSAGARRAALLAAASAPAGPERPDDQVVASLWNQIASELPDREHEALVRAVLGSPHVLAPAALQPAGAPRARRPPQASPPPPSPAPRPAAPPPTASPEAPPPAAPPTPAASPAAPAPSPEPVAQPQLRLPLTPATPPVVAQPPSSGPPLDAERSQLLAALSTRIAARAPEPAPKPSPPQAPAPAPAPAAEAPPPPAPPPRKPRAKRPAAPEPEAPRPAPTAAAASPDDEAVRDLSGALSTLFPPVNNVASSKRRQHLVFVSAERGSGAQDGLVVTMELLLLAPGEKGKLEIGARKRQSLPLAGSRILNAHERSRAKAFLEGWSMAVEAVLDRPAVPLADLMPVDLTATQVLGQNALDTAPQFRDALLDRSRLGKLLGR